MNRLLKSRSKVLNDRIGDVCLYLYVALMVGWFVLFR